MSAVTNALIKSFLKQNNNGIFNTIVTSIADTGLFFPAVVGQLSVESGNGQSDLATQYNNYGGVKGDSSNGVALDTTEGNNRSSSQAYFRIFSSFQDFMNYYVSNIVNNPRYAAALQATSPEAQISALVSAGYSTMSPKAYLANGVQDRINATRDLFPFGKISASQAALITPPPACAPWLLNNILCINQTACS